MAPLCKIVILGSGGVGKSAITSQFINKVFIEKYDPTIEDSYRKHHEVDGQPVVLEILDTAGTEQFSAMRNLYMKNSEGFIFVFSLVSYSSFLELNELRDQVLRVKEEPDVPMLLLGNKCDFPVEERTVPQEELQNLVKKWKVQYFEVSAKNNVNVTEGFEGIVRQIFKKQMPVKKKINCYIL